MGRKNATTVKGWAPSAGGAQEPQEHPVTTPGMAWEHDAPDPCQRVPPRLALTVRNSTGTARSASSALEMITAAS